MSIITISRGTKSGGLELANRLSKRLGYETLSMEMVISESAKKYNIMQAAMASSERLFKLLDTKPAFAQPTDSARMDGFKGEIQFKDVWFAYNGEEWILKDIKDK